MPVDRQAWANELHLSNFVNTYAQYRDLQQFPNCRSILVIGPGQGLDTAVLRWRGYQVSTFDIDTTFSPDYIGSVHDLSQFADRQFDAVIASHVLEHLAEPYLDRCLQELARVARYSMIYLPIHGRHLHLRFMPGFKGIDLSLLFSIFNPFEKPTGIEAKYMEGQHFWEVGMRSYRVRDLRKRMSRWFEIQRSYRNREWVSSYNFVLKSKL